MTQDTQQLREAVGKLKVIVAGSRDINLTVGSIAIAVERSRFRIAEVVSGCARGIDALGEAWAKLNHVPVKRFPAQWKEHGKSAGPRRNEEMADYADALIAIWDGESRGTRHMIEAMQRRNKPCHVIGYCHVARQFTDTPPGRDDAKG